MIKEKKTNKEKQEQKDNWNFNEGRLNADRKWIDAIDRRIEELEIQVGIPELRKLKKDGRYKWRNED